MVFFIQSKHHSRFPLQTACDHCDTTASWLASLHHTRTSSSEQATASSRIKMCQRWAEDHKPKKLGICQGPCFWRYLAELAALTWLGAEEAYPPGLPQRDLDVENPVRQEMQKVKVKQFLALCFSTRQCRPHSRCWSLAQSSMAIMEQYLYYSLEASVLSCRHPESREEGRELPTEAENNFRSQSVSTTQGGTSPQRKHCCSGHPADGKKKI